MKKLKAAPEDEWAPNKEAPVKSKASLTAIQTSCKKNLIKLQYQLMNLMRLMKMQKRRKQKFNPLLTTNRLIKSLNESKPCNYRRDNLKLKINPLISTDSLSSRKSN